MANRIGILETHGGLALAGIFHVCRIGSSGRNTGKPAGHGTFQPAGGLADKRHFLPRVAARRDIGRNDCLRNEVGDFDRRAHLAAKGVQNSQ